MASSYPNNGYPMPPSGGQQQQQQQQQWASSASVASMGSGSIGGPPMGTPMGGSYYGGASTAYGTVPPPQQPPPSQPHPQQQQQAPMGSYAARSAQAYAQQQQQPTPQPGVYNFAPQPGMTPTMSGYPPQQQQQQQPPPPSGVYGVPPQANGSASSYAARSTQAYQQHQQQQQQQQQQFPSSGASVASSYQARSAHAYASHAAGTPPSTPAAYMAANNTMTAPPPQQQQQPPMPPQPPPPPKQQPPPPPQQQPPMPQQQPGMMGSSTMGQPTVAAVPGGGGYAARSVQAHSMAGTFAAPPSQTPPTLQPTMQQQPQQPPQQPSVYPGVPPPAAVIPSSSATVASTLTHATQMPGPAAGVLPQVQALQQRLLTDATRKVQEHAYYMRQAMDQNNLPVVLERAAYMVGELGTLPHGQQAAASAAHTPTPAASPSLSNTGCSARMTPKTYYELYMRALEDMSAFEDYLMGLAQPQLGGPAFGAPVMGGAPHMQAASNPIYNIQPDLASTTGSMWATPQQPQQQQNQQYTMRELYDCVQYSPRVLPRLYLQITAGAALIRTGFGAKWVLQDLMECVKCEQNPIRGLFLRNYLLTALRDKLPDSEPRAAAGEDGMTEISTNDEPAALSEENDKGTVVDSYEFVVANFMEMNKLWVRLQHLPGDGNTKDVKKRRERERNDLRILVGTNLVRISQLEGVTSKIYGEKILPRILDHVVTVGDPLSQAYLMDCLVQVFPDEYHIETLPILLNACPRLRDKVNIRTILQGLMDRLANYLAEEELLDESDTNQVKLTLARDSFGMFEECVEKVYNARGPKLTSKEVIRLQTTLLQFSLKCYPGNIEQIARCMSSCVTALQQANASYEIVEPTVAPVPKSLDEVSVTELEKLLSIPLDSLALRVLEMDRFSDLIGFLPWNNRRGVAKTMLEAVDKAGSPPKSVKEIQQLFSVIEPLMRSDTMQQYQFDGGPQSAEMEKEYGLVSKLVQLLNHEDTDVVYEMLVVAREQVRQGSPMRVAPIMISVVFAALELGRRIRSESTIVHVGEVVSDELGSETKGVGDVAKPETDAEDVESSETAAKDEKKEATLEETKPESPPEEAAAENPEEKTEDGQAAEAGAEKATEENESKPAPEETTAETVKTNALKLLLGDHADAPESDAPKTEAPVETTKSISVQHVFQFIRETIAMVATANVEVAIKLFTEAALVADSFAIASDGATYAPITYELFSQSFSLYEESVSDSQIQYRCVIQLVGALLASKSLGEGEYEALITKTTQFSAKLVKKEDQCRMVAQCAHLFFPVSQENPKTYSNPQKALECLQRALKLADGCTSANPANLELFVDLLEQYVYFLENKNPVISAAYVTGLVALVKEYLGSLGENPAVAGSRAHFNALILEIKRKAAADETSAVFSSVQVE